MAYLVARRPGWYVGGWSAVLFFGAFLAQDLLATGSDGTLPELLAGGPVITASGLLFIAATKDGMFRAFDKKTGKILWETKLPAAGFATPSTYQVNGRQYVVIACGGTKLGTKMGNQYVAFALP